MKKIDLQALKAEHRLESVMQEFGEQFEANGNLWLSKTTLGLIVNIRQQSYEYDVPGMDKEIGDLFDWLARRFNWSFKMVIAYLRKRDPDPKQDEQVHEATKNNEDVPIPVYQGSSTESGSRDSEKEESSLYECGVGYRDGKVYYSYLLKPCDIWQQRALDVGGERMRHLFTWNSRELLQERDRQPVRFIPIQDMDVEICDECEKPIDWWWKQAPQYAYREMVTPGSTGSTFSKIRIIEEPQVFAFEYELYEDTFCICEDCKRKKINYRAALDLLYRSARKREAPVRLLQEEGVS